MGGGVLIVVLAEQLQRQIKLENQIAADWLLYYKERKRQHLEQRRQLEDGCQQAAVITGSRSTGVARPVESMAIKLSEHDQGNDAKWLQVVEAVADLISIKKQQLLQARQECRFYISPAGGRPGWIAPVQQRYGELSGWCPAERTLQDMWRSIVTLAVRIANIQGCRF